MAKVELDETELVKLQNVARVVDRMLANPASRTKVLEAHKIVNPDAVVPEIDSAKPLKDEMGAISKQVSDLAKKIDDDKTERETKARKDELDVRWNTGKMAARKAGYTEEGLKALEEFMVEKGVVDHDVAMAAFERTHPLPAPVSSSNPGFNVFHPTSDTNTDMKKLMDSQGQDGGVVHDLIQKTLSDVRTGGR